jgi:hypothetical protein
VSDSDPGKTNFLQQVGTPKEYAQTPPPVELYPTSDIRFVMVELGKLSTKVDRLVDDVKGNSEKVSELKTKMSQFETTFKVGSLCIAAFLALLWWFLGDHIKVAVNNAMKAAIIDGSVIKPINPIPPNSSNLQVPTQNPQR